MAPLTSKLEANALAPSSPMLLPLRNNSVSAPLTLRASVIAVAPEGPISLAPRLWQEESEHIVRSRSRGGQAMISGVPFVRKRALTLLVVIRSRRH
eukprot:1615424-Prymnesium_polylepis.1